MLMCLLQVKMNGMLLEGENLSRFPKFVSAMREDKASFEGILDDLQYFEEDEQVEGAEQ
jgi:hypothetical protein